MTSLQFQTILSRHKRVAIMGGPSTGKTELSKLVYDGRPVHHNDTAKHLSWEDHPKHWIEQAKGQPSFVIEGVHSIRAVRRGLKVDAIIHLTKPHQIQSDGQRSMSKGQATILREVAKDHPEIKIYES